MLKRKKMNIKSKNADGRILMEMRYDTFFKAYVITQGANVIKLNNDDIDKLVDFVIKTEENQQRTENEQRAN